MVSVWIRGPGLPAHPHCSLHKSSFRLDWNKIRKCYIQPERKATASPGSISTRFWRESFCQQQVKDWLTPSLLLPVTTLMFMRIALSEWSNRQLHFPVRIWYICDPWYETLLTQKGPEHRTVSFRGKLASLLPRSSPRFPQKCSPDGSCSFLRSQILDSPLLQKMRRVLTIYLFGRIGCPDFNEMMFLWTILLDERCLGCNQNQCWSFTRLSYFWGKRTLFVWIDTCYKIRNCSGGRYAKQAIFL